MHPHHASILISSQVMIVLYSKRFATKVYMMVLGGKVLSYNKWKSCGISNKSLNSNMHLEFQSKPFLLFS